MILFGLLKRKTGLIVYSQLLNIFIINVGVPMFISQVANVDPRLNSPIFKVNLHINYI